MPTTSLRPGRDLHALHQRINDLNSAILTLVKQRSEAVIAIAQVKEELGITAFDQRREEEMLRRVVRAAQGPYDEGELREIFTALFRASLALQQRARRPRAQRQRRRQV